MLTTTTLLPTDETEAEFEEEEEEEEEEDGLLVDVRHQGDPDSGSFVGGTT